MHQISTYSRICNRTFVTTFSLRIYNLKLIFVSLVGDSSGALLLVKLKF